MGISP